MATQTYQPVPITFADEKEHRRQMAVKINSINQSKFNCALEVTLTANSASTTIADARISSFSVILMMPITANAAAEISGGGLYIPETTMLNGSAVIQHANNAQTDRNFRIGIFG